MDTRKRPREELEQRVETQAAETQALKAERRADAARQEEHRLKRQRQDTERRRMERFADGREEVLEAGKRKYKAKYLLLLRAVGGSTGSSCSSD